MRVRFKNTPHTLFAVLICWNAGVRHCVYNIVKEHSVHKETLRSEAHFSKTDGTARIMIFLKRCLIFDSLVFDW